jgi:hypothetical protein
MAIGRHDTDALYDECIGPAIKEAGLRPIRVDRVVHNDRIDNKIREEIADAAVMVADLTYARPSVYWEAGFAERAVPVVYTCRQDHLHQAESDRYGNLAVHFDLRNANILTWRRQGSVKFRKDLVARLRLVTAPLRRDRETRAALSIERAEFAQLSLTERRALVSGKVDVVLKSQGYKECGSLRHLAPITRGVAFARHDMKLLWTLAKGTLVLIDPSYCFDSLQKQDLEWASQASILSDISNDRRVQWGNLPKDLRKLTRRKVRSIRRIRLVSVLKAITSGRIEQTLGRWRRLESASLYYLPSFRRTQFYPDNEGHVMPSSSEVLLLSGIKSLSEFESELADALSAVENRQDTLIGD